MDLKMEDLFVTCKRCNGSGNVTETTGGGQPFGPRQTTTFGPCPDCNGMRGKFTPAGEVLRQFIDLVKR